MNIELLEQNFQQIQPQAGEFADSFYRHLFADYPETQTLFAQTDLGRQKKMLLSALMMVVENLRHRDTLTHNLKSLGARHLQYGVLPEHYALVGATLLKTFESYLGSDWTPEVKKAWADAYACISQMMLSET